MSKAVQLGIFEQRQYYIVDERGWGWNGGKPAFTESWTAPESRSGIPPVRFVFHDDAQRVAQGLLRNFKTVIIVEVFSDRQQTPAGSG